MKVINIKFILSTLFILFLVGVKYEDFLIIFTSLINMGIYTKVLEENM